MHLAAREGRYRASDVRGSDSRSQDGCDVGKRNVVRRMGSSGLVLADAVEKGGFDFDGKKYAPNIEIFSFGRRFQARISHSGVQKWRSRLSMVR